MYITEISPTSLRGALGVTCQLGITVGILASQILGLNSVLGTDQSWPLLLFLFAPLCFVAFVLTFFLPESPKYLYVKKQHHELAIKGLLKKTKSSNQKHVLLFCKIHFQFENWF